MKFRHLLSVSLALGAGLLGPQVFGQNATQIVIINNTGLPDDAVYFNLTGSSNFTNNYYGSYSNGTAISAGTSYSLAQAYGNVVGASTGGPVGTVPTISLGNYTNGFIDFTLGVNIGNVQTPANTPYVSSRVEGYWYGNSTSDNIDVSYANYVGLPTSFAIKSRADGSLIPLPGFPNPVNTTAGDTIFNLLSQNTTVTPVDARLTATGTNYPVLNSSNATMGYITGITRVVAPGAYATDYHSWVSPSTGNVSTTALLPYMQANNITLQIANYTVPGNATLAGTNFGYTGTAPGSGGSPFNATIDPHDDFQKGQSYNMNAVVTGNLVAGLTANQTAALASQNITAGTSGVVISGTVGNGNIGAFSVFMTNATLADANSIYGEQPQYVVLWKDVTTGGNIAVASSGNNNLVDRIVGDFTGALNLGMANSQKVISDQANITNTEANIANSIFGAGNIAANMTIGNISTGEFFYLLSLQGNTTDVAKWFGSSIQDNPYFYNTYSGAWATETTSYTTAYGDRLQGISNPNPNYLPSGNLTDLNNLYIEITLEPGGYSYSAVPEPSTVALVIGVGALGVGLWRKRKRTA